MRQLQESYRILLELTPTKFYRSIHDAINWENRLIGILGFKGVGKSTMLLQHILKTHTEEQSLYVQADDFYFNTHRLFDLAKEFMSRGGKYLYIDEIHKYIGWSGEVKQIYDQLPLLKVVYSGSSILDLHRVGADLSRRTREYTMTGLSFREYLNMTQGWSLRPSTLDEILNGRVDFPYGEHRPLACFERYMREGFYPFSSEPDFHYKLKRAVQVTVDEDIPRYAGMTIASREQLKKLMYVLAQNVPYKPNYSELERDLGIRRALIPDYIAYLEKARLLSALREKSTGNALMRKVEKLYLDNPNVAYAVCEEQPDRGTLRETVFLAWVKDLYPVTSSPISDFEIDGRTFEVGGAGKRRRQLRDAAEGYVVKDDIEYASGNTLPLWMFGFAY